VHVLGHFFFFCPFWKIIQVDLAGKWENREKEGLGVKQ
jgi:hypothetical protein